MKILLLYLSHKMLGLAFSLKKRLIPFPVFSSLHCWCCSENWGVVLAKVDGLLAVLALLVKKTSYWGWSTSGASGKASALPMLA